MAERRALVEGLKPKEPPVDPVKEKEFVFGAKEAAPVPAEPHVEATTLALNFNGRVPLSTRMRCCASRKGRRVASMWCMVAGDWGPLLRHSPRGIKKPLR